MAREPKVLERTTDVSTDRRRFLLAAGSAAASAALAGCNALAGDVDERTGAGSAPTASSELLAEGGWEQAETSENRLLDRSYLGGQVQVTADAETVTYEKAALRQSVAERTLGQLDTTLGVFSVTNLDIEPNPADLPLGLGVKQLLSEVRETAGAEFEAQLRGAGITDVRRTGETDVTVADGRNTALVEYAGKYGYEEMRIPLPAADQYATVEGGSIEMAGALAAWRDGRYIVVAGGAHPAENFAQTVEADLSDAISVDVAIDLGLTPATYAEELRNLIASVR